MARPITLFTGQWADLTLDDLAGKASSFGFDGLELACWGDHFEVDRAVAEPDYAAGRRELLERHGLGAGRSATTSSARRCATRSTRATRACWRPRSGATAIPEGVRTRAAERMKDTARAAAAFGVPVVTGFTGSAIWHQLYSFPPNDWAQIERGYEEFAERWGPIIDVFDAEGVRFALEVHPTEIAYDFVTTRKTLAADRPPRGLRDQPRPQPLHPAVPRPGGLRSRVRRSHLPRARQGLAGHARRPALDPRLAHRLRRGRPRLDLRLARATATSTSRRSSAC